MRKLNRINNKILKGKKLVRKDFIDQSDSKQIRDIMIMLENDIYQFRVKKHLYSTGKISAAGFAYNSDIFLLPLGKKDFKGNILIENGIMDIFDRYMFSMSVAEKGDSLTAFIIDYDDDLYNILKSNLSADTKIGEDEYIEAFNKAYKRVGTKILESEIDDFIAKDSKIISLIK